MRFYALAAMLVLAAGLSACSKSSSDQSSSAATAAPDAAATAAADTGGAAATDAPKDGGSVADADVYPGATLKAGGTSSNGMMGGTAAGKVYVTDDAYDKVTAWYKDHMPADAHMTHMSAAGSSSTVYVKGLGTSNQETLSITSSPATQGKTWITVAQVKK